MKKKNDVEVVINGKQYTLSGYESNQYMQQIAGRINDKYKEFKQQEGYNRLDNDMRNILLAINLSDDYFKAQKIADDYRQQKEEMEKEIFDIKHELISKQAETEDLLSQLKAVKKEAADANKRIIRLETELDQNNK